MARALSAMLLPVSLGMAGEMPLKATSFSHFPGYTGELNVSGNFTVGRDKPGSQVIFYEFEGMDAACGEFTVNETTDECGIRIYAGSSCDHPGDPYYGKLTTGDPWFQITYDTVEGRATRRNVRLTTNASLADMKNRTVVVHDSSGAPAACSRLLQLNETGVVYAPALSIYPGYLGSLRVQGSVEIAQGDGAATVSAQVLRFSFKGSDVNCNATANLSRFANACEISIHEGTTCADHKSVGDTFFDKKGISEDPWTGIQYVSSSGVTTPVVTGLSLAKMLGRALVVYDSIGRRAACAVIQKSKTITQAAVVTSFAGSGSSPRWWVLVVSAGLTWAAW